MIWLFTSIPALLVFSYRDGWNPLTTMLFSIWHHCVSVILECIFAEFFSRPIFKFAHADKGSNYVSIMMIWQSERPSHARSLARKTVRKRCEHPRACSFSRSCFPIRNSKVARKKLPFMYPATHDWIRSAPYGTSYWPYRGIQRVDNLFVSNVVCKHPRVFARFLSRVVFA